MKPSAEAGSPGGCCGKCSRKIRMRENVHVVLCTIILERVPADEPICAHYEATVDDSDLSESS